MKRITSMCSVVKALWQDGNKADRLMKLHRHQTQSHEHRVFHQVDHCVVPTHQLFDYVLVGPPGWHIDLSVATSLCWGWGRFFPCLALLSVTVATSTSKCSRCHRLPDVLLSVTVRVVTFRFWGLLLPAVHWLVSLCEKINQCSLLNHAIHCFIWLIYLFRLYMLSWTLWADRL